MVPNHLIDRRATRVADDPGLEIEVAKVQTKDRHLQKIDDVRSVVVRARSAVAKAKSAAVKAKSVVARARRSAAPARKGARVGRENPENLVQGMSPIQK